jgi:hypothetical protein
MFCENNLSNTFQDVTNHDKHLSDVGNASTGAEDRTDAWNSEELLRDNKLLVCKYLEVQNAFRVADAQHVMANQEICRLKKEIKELRFREEQVTCLQDEVMQRRWESEWWLGWRLEQLRCSLEGQCTEIESILAVVEVGFRKDVQVSFP